VVRRGHRLRQKLLLALFPLLARSKPTDFMRILMYRPELFGKPFGKYAEAALRGPSSWSVGEREMFGAYVSTLNECDFCADLHCAIAARALGRSDVFAGNRPEVVAVLDFLRRLESGSVGSDDLAPLRAAGLTDQAIMEAVHAATVLTVANRVVTALGARKANPGQRDSTAAMLLKLGYDL